MSVHSKSFIKSCFVLVCLVQPAVATWVNARHIVFPGQIQSTICPDAAFSFNLVSQHGRVLSHLTSKCTMIDVTLSFCKSKLMPSEANRKLSNVPPSPAPGPAELTAPLPAP